MPLIMQGRWTVSVHAKQASFKQRFIIQGSDNADGTYDGVTSLDPVVVLGDTWTLEIQHRQNKSGAPWTPSDMRYATPTKTGATVRVLIESNDTGNDSDFNDLVLACRHVQGINDYLVYGRVRTYENCLFNPCRQIVVIDTLERFRKLLVNPAILEAVRAYYPELPRQVIKGQVTEATYRPVVLPLGAGAGVEVGAVEDVVVGTPPAGDEPVLEAEAAEAAEGGEAPPPVVRLAARPEFGSAVQVRSDLLIELARFRDRFRLRCDVAPLPGAYLRFQEYDRTNDELAGGPYTGDGNRHFLGAAVTDAFGNYLFRFRVTPADVLEEIFRDIAAGEDVLVAVRPDVIVQLPGAAEDGGDVLFETAAYSNIAKVRRIDLCIPRSKLNPGITSCQGGRAIQAIGNIWTIAGVGNTFDAVGRVTATNPNGPQTQRAGWFGRLDLFACFLDFDGQVATYTVEYRRAGEVSFTDVEELYRHPKVADIGSPGYVGTQVGPFYDKGNDLAGRPYYLNIESNPAWIATHRLRKLQLRSALYQSSTGRVTFRIRGYDAAGNVVAGAEDQIDLYVDNRPVVGDIDTVSIAGGPSGECALFTVVTNHETAEVRYRADQPAGLMRNYALVVLRGSASNVAVTDAVDPERVSEVYTEAEHNGVFYGTADVASADGAGYVTAQITPDGGWLPEGHDFCAFAFEVHARGRRTTGYSNESGRRLDLELVGIERAPAP